MPQHRRRMSVLIVALIVAAGCSKSGVSQFRTNAPAEATALVLERYDSNKDGKLVAGELAASPGLVDGVGRIDANRDGGFDAAELEARFAAHDQMSDIIGFQVRITANQAPLSGATVTFIPEPFMGEGKQSYVGTTADSGMCYVSGDEVKLPGVPVGFYKVHIVHAASGADVTRGCEVGDDMPSPNRLAFDTELSTVPTAAGRR